MVEPTVGRPIAGAIDHRRDRFAAALCPIEDLALWADPNSVADGTRRIYSTLGNPNLLAGYLVPILPLAVIGLLRWQGIWPKLLALSSLGCGLAAALLSYSRGGWIGLLLALGSLGLLLLLRQSRRLGPLWGKLLPPLVITAVVVALVLAAIKVEPLRIRLTSMLAGRATAPTTSASTFGWRRWR